MGSVMVVPAEIDRLVEFVNTWCPAVHCAAGTTIDPESRVGCGDEGVLVAGTAEALSTVATLLHAVFADPDAAGRRARLNRLVGELAPLPRLDEHGETWEVTEVDAGMGSLIFALWACARDDSDLARLGTCDDVDCVDAFVDRSRAGSRRFCSTTCQNRAAVRDHRQRKR